MEHLAHEGAQSTAVTTQRTTRSNGWSHSWNHRNTSTYHYNNYKGNQSPSATQTSPDTRTSRLHPGLHSTGDKKITLPFSCCCWGYFFFISMLQYTQTVAPRALHHRHQSAVTLLIYCWWGWKGKEIREQDKWLGFCLVTSIFWAWNSSTKQTAVTNQLLQPSNNMRISSSIF